MEGTVGCCIDKNQKKRFLVAGTSYFPEGRGPKYHRIKMLSLLCSEWEEVGHILMKHRQLKIFSFDFNA